MRPELGSRVIIPKQMREFLRLTLFLLLLLPPGSLCATNALDSGACAINREDGTFTTGGFVALTGFAVDSAQGAPVRKIEITLDGKLNGEASLMGLRPDVLKSFARADYLWSGWSGTISLREVRAGKHTLQAVAVLRSGKRIDCGARGLDVLTGPAVPEQPPWQLATKILLRTTIFLVWLVLVGWAPATLLGSRPATLSAPFLGLALFAVFTEGGSLLRVQPFASATCLTLLSTLALLVLLRIGRVRWRRPPQLLFPTLLCMALFMIVGVGPLASHGEGAVLGDIDDAVRECSVADSLTSYGWNIPADIRGYFAAIPAAMQAANVRPGGSYILSALSRAFGLRAHDVFSVAMLSIGCLLIWGTSLLAHRVFSHLPGRAWVSPALVTLNSTLFATVFGQHLGTLLGAVLFLPFLYYSLILVRSSRLNGFVPLALTAAAGFTLYPEVIASWIVAALLSLTVVTSFRMRTRAITRLSLAAMLAIILNPIGFSRATKYLLDTVPRSEYMASPYQRLIAGDTHYYAPLTVIAGIEAYREDAPAPVGSIRSSLIPLTTGLSLLVAVLGWIRLTVREKCLLGMVLVPVALTLYVNWLLGFPYGFSKFLLAGVPVWSVSFVLLSFSALKKASGHSDGQGPGKIVLITFALIAVLQPPALRHVIGRASHAVPSYDQAFRRLPDLASAVGPDAIIHVNQPLNARREWMRYFLGGNAVRTDQETMPLDGARHFLLIDRRDHRPTAAHAVATQGNFILVPFSAQSQLGTGH